MPLRHEDARQEELQPFVEESHEARGRFGKATACDEVNSELHAELGRLRKEVWELRRLNELRGSPPRNEDSLHFFWHRTGWLVGLLLFQSTSSVILEHFGPLLQYHPVVVYFLTMLVGAGGNAGGQSTVLVVRRLALEKVSGLKSSQTNTHIIAEQLFIGFRLAAILSLACVVRCWLFRVVGYEALAIGISMFCIVVVSTLLGSSLPLLLRHLHVDPAHAGAAIQVLMDIGGVLLTCVVACLVLGVSLSGQPRADPSEGPIQMEETRQNHLGFPSETLDGS
mmetsp:Transcript_64968/g.141609  ORF Transcript_64968/g.141609 Transcript_64968/m.141609 type:complete len:281 (+) Transcript_64968:43-885(+)|eukprot:CAMPEP_0170626384 /NCGR_PEP_ID=MMETSP0224-20130122/31328_1 /TAXON_ID=285029 /ORGANISM="Togula jolla, Strain CCCM 725" /LENGTH=280 /DNA_ID=CAMNT_0010953151 /DNA_START=28 /DNA_END=870 /DNA_ORIENTATION=-